MYCSFSFLFQSKKCDESRNLESGASVKILPDPSETFTVALSLKDRAHEKFEGPSMKLWPRNFAFPSCLTIQAKSLTEFFFRTGTRPVDLVAENKDGAVCELLIREKRVELGFWLDKSVSITNIDQKNDGIDGGKIISPNLKLKIEELVEFLTTDETWIMDIYVTVSMDRTSSAPNILSAVYFWIRFFDFDLKYWILSSILTFYYSITCCSWRRDSISRPPRLFAKKLTNNHTKPPWLDPNTNLKKCVCIITNSLLYTFLCRVRITTKICPSLMAAACLW